MTPNAWPPVFTAGFRLFFLLGAVAAITVVARVALLLTGLVPSPPDPFGWHAHEMLFGYVAAVIVGFLLTAVPNWTGTRPVSGMPLLLLGGLWLIARIGFWGADPGWWGRAADLAFLPAAALVAATALWRRGSLRQWLPVALILLIASANALWHLSIQLGQPALTGRVLAFATMLIALLIGVIGGRVVPAFTRNRLASVGEPLPRPHGTRDELALAVSLLVAIAELFAPTAAAVLALAAALLHAARMYGWRGLRVTGDPLLFVLHVGYAWLALGYALRASVLLGPSWSLTWALHGMLVGAIGTMTLAIMARATLGHTGHALRAGPLLVSAFLAVQGAAVARLLEPWLGYPAWLWAALFWCGGFGAYLLRCGPMLLRSSPTR